MIELNIEQMRALAAMFWNGSKDDREASKMLHAAATEIENLRARIIELETQIRHSKLSPEDKARLNLY